MLKRLLLALLLLPGLASAQFIDGHVLTAAQLNSAFANTLPISGGILTGPLTVPSLSVTGSPIAIASGGTNCATASGTCLDNIAGFSNTGFLERTGSGAYTFVADPLSLSHGGTGAATATAATAALQYLQGATGSGARSLTNKFQDTTSVLDFAGCDVTGSTDSTTCMQNAIASFTGSVTGGIVYMPPGIYKASGTSPLNFGDKQNIYLKGAGINATVIRATSGVTTLVQFGNTGTNDQGISDLTLDCTAASATATALLVQNVNTFSLSNVAILSPKIGFSLNSGTTQFFTNFTILGATNTAIYVHGGNDQFLTNGYISNQGYTAASVAGINSDSNGALWIVNVDVIGNKDGLLFNPGSGAEIDWPFVMNSAFDSGTGNGINFAPTGTGFIKGGTFIGNWTSSNTLAGVSFSATSGSVDGVRFIGHRSFNNVQQGYTIATGANTSNIEFDSSDASGNSASVPGTYGGYEIGSNVTSFAIRNARSGPQAKFSDTQSRGIIVQPGSSSNYTLIGNDVRGNTINRIYDGGTGTAKVIKGNLGYNPIASTSITVTASPFTYTNNTGDTINVFVTGGTVSSVTLGGNTVATATNTVVPVPQGTSVVVTYSAAPTMTYIGY